MHILNNISTRLTYNTMKTELILQQLEAKHPGEAEYLQAVREVLLSIEGTYNRHP